MLWYDTFLKNAKKPSHWKFKIQYQPVHTAQVIKYHLIMGLYIFYKRKIKKSLAEHLNPVNLNQHNITLLDKKIYIINSTLLDQPNIHYE